MNTEASSLDESVELKKLNLSVDVKANSACQRHVKVTIPREDIERYYKKQFDDLAPRAELPGFRAGKAPRQLVEKKFRKQISDQVKGALLMDSLAQVNDGAHFSAISEPDLDYDQVNVPETGSMTFEFDIEVRPEFELPNWKGLTIERPEREFTAQDVEQYLKMLAGDEADLVPVNGPIQAEDEVTFNIVASADGKSLFTHEETSLAVLPVLSFNDGVIEGFDKLMIGKTTGDKISSTFSVSEHADNIDLQGKTIELEFEVLDVKRVDTIDENVLADKYSLESPEKLREEIKRSLENQVSYEQRQQVRNQISAVLTDSADWDLPPELLKRQFRRELSRALMELRTSGFSQDQIKARENMLRQDAMARTETLLKEHFILERIAEQEKIEDEPADYEIEIARMAMSTGDSPRRIRSRLEKTGQIDVMRNMIIERKVIDLIEKEANFKAMPYELPTKRKIEAADFSVTGDSSGFIPEAKYDVQPETAIPGQPKKDGRD